REPGVLGCVHEPGCDPLSARRAPPGARRARGALPATTRLHPARRASTAERPRLPARQPAQGGGARIATREPEDRLSVAELLVLARENLRDGLGEIVVEGEIASLFRSRPGHLYFDLKDERAILRAVMFRGDQLAELPLERGLLEPENGMLVR